MTYHAYDENMADVTIVDPGVRGPIPHSDLPAVFWDAGDPGLAGEGWCLRYLLPDGCEMDEPLAAHDDRNAGEAVREASRYLALAGRMA